MPLLSWPVWQWGRLFLLTAASTLALYILLDDDLVMTSWEINRVDSPQMIKGSHTTSCRKLNVDMENSDFELNYCLDEEEKDVGYYNMIEGRPGKSSGTYKCEDHHGDPAIDDQNDLYGDVFQDMLQNLQNYNDVDVFLDPLLFPPVYQDGNCCERLQDARVRLIAGSSFTVAAMIAAGLAIFYSQKSTSATSVGGNWVYLVCICFVFSAVATGLFGSALELSDTNGIWTCNHKFEQNYINYRASLEHLDGYSENDIFETMKMKESREMGFWLLMALVVTLGGHLLIELVVFGATFLKNFKKGAPGSSSSNKIQEFTAKLLF